MKQANVYNSLAYAMIGLIVLDYLVITAVSMLNQDFYGSDFHQRYSPFFNFYLPAVLLLACFTFIVLGVKQKARKFTTSQAANSNNVIAASKSAVKIFSIALLPATLFAIAAAVINLLSVDDRSATDMLIGLSLGLLVPYTIVCLILGVTFIVRDYVLLRKSPGHSKKKHVQLYASFCAQIVVIVAASLVLL